jgi:hypothetical protein
MKIQEKNSIARWSGVIQDDRMLKALMPDYVKIDERSLSDLLAFASEYAKLTSYYTEHNDIDPERNDWYRFYINDVSVFISTIIATDLKTLELEHRRLAQALENAPRTEEKIEIIEEMIDHLLTLYKQINGWYERTLQISRYRPQDSSDLENELENAIKQQLSRSLQFLMEYRRDLGLGERGVFSDENISELFHAMWFKRHNAIDTGSPDLVAGSLAHKISVYTKYVRLEFRTAYSVTAYLLQIAPKFLKTTLEEKDDHRPDIGLFISFLQLFKHAQDQLNSLTEQHLDFYYYDVLKLSERTYRPDQAHVYFQIAQHVDTHFLPKGTLLQAGVDAAGQLRQYATEFDLELNKAKIEQLKTLYVSKNTKIGIGSSYRLITNLYAAPIANSRNGMGERFINDVEDWPTFGEELLDKSEQDRQMTFGDVGFAITSPILEMEEGHRIITVKLEFDRTSMHTLNLLIKDISRNQGSRPDDAFSRVFRNSLRTYFSTTAGWTEADTCEVLPSSDPDTPEITLVVTLSAAAPPIIGYLPEWHGEGFDTKAPVLKILHQNINSIFSYSFFKELILQRIMIDVTAKGLRRLMLSSDLGGLDASTPFMPFGPIPKIGSYMLVGKAELFKKELTDLQFNIEWQQVPDHAKGFKGYFRDYNAGINNDDFKVRITALSEGAYYPLVNDLPLDYSLFAPHPEYPQNVSKYNVWDDIDVRAFNIKPNPSLQLPAAFNNEVRSGYFRIEFVSPKFAFGQDQYPVVYTKAVTNNASPRKKEDMPLPNPPFVPLIKSFTIDYSAKTQINIVSVGTMSPGEGVEEQFYHLHPYGIIRTFYKGKSSNRYLVPTYDDDAYLYIGLRGLTPPTPLTFYFELRDNPDNLDIFDSANSSPEIIWSYMSNNEWRDFSQTQILSDTTYGFNNSGIISLEVPRDLTNNNNILPAQLHWLRVTIRGDANRMPRTIKVATQAVLATWQNNENSTEHLTKQLPAKNITALSHIVAQVREVEQPFKTFGGKAAETKNEFYTRVSERLRHKNRAISAWDFERLVLDNFPEIFQAKCVTHLGHEEYVEKGSVNIVVVPKIDPDNIQYLPRVNYSRLQNIREFLQAHTSPFIKVEVRNPIYERVKITAGVRFQKGKNNGTFLKKLNQDITSYLCPWLHGISRELELGGSLSKDMVLSFIEKRPYVDFVTKFSAVQVFYDDTKIQDKDTKKAKDLGLDLNESRPIGFEIDDTAIDVTSLPTIQASKPWSVLIPFETNPIYLLDDTNFQAPEKSSINSMIINGDFVMTVEKSTEIEIYNPNKRK